MHRYHVIGINFGSKADDEKHYVNKTAEMGARCRQWIIEGGAIYDDIQLEKELVAREFWHDDRDRLVLERKKDMKKRIKVSPDWADSLYLTFAQHVPKRELPRGQLDAAISMRDRDPGDYNPLSQLDSGEYN